MKQFFTLFGLLLMVLSVSAQKQVALSSSGEYLYFGGSDAFSKAYEAAIDGDTIYLPGLEYSAPTIEKQIVVYGTGFHPEATEASGVTRLNGLHLRSQASGSYFEGILFEGSVSFGSGQKVDDVQFKRCFFNSSLSLSGPSDGYSKNVVIAESILTAGFNGAGSYGLIFRNNILKNNSYNLMRNIHNSAWIHNNIISGRGYRTPNFQSRYMILNISGALFENNVIYNYDNSSYTFHSDVSNNTFLNNIFNYDPTDDNENTWELNFIDVSIPDIFIDYIDDNFSFEENYKLENPETFPGTIGPVGIFGGTIPVKDNYVPSVPHITSKNIERSLDESGSLFIDIEVEAQDY
ncbi:hypothetical protein QA597_07885 [Marinilabiliaceae bacterium ANBcel2]|nr:hypothetical protein [Marinilabiliaceae bacterium ANBcel2]